MAVDFRWSKSLGEFEIDWARKGDEWVQRIHKYFADVRGCAGFGLRRGGDIGEFIELRVGAGEGQLDTRLLILPKTESVVNLWICGTGEAEAELDVTVWTAAVSEALEGLREPHKVHEWTAIIGTLPSKMGDRVVKMGDPCDIAEIRFSSTERIFREPWRVNASLSSWKIYDSVPILVRGRSSGYDWQHVQKDAAENLNRLVGLLSVAWGFFVDVREAAAPLELGERYAPDVSPWMSESMHGESRSVSTVDVLEVPDWINGAWQRLKRQKRLDAAIGMYMEGVRVQDEHDSLALVSFVAVVEAISLSLFHEQRCPGCKGHLNIGAKFRETLKLVLSPDEAEELNRVYSSRSKTVHTGRLYGGESSPGAFAFSFFEKSTEIEFSHQMVQRMKNVARNLLQMALRGDLPGKSHYEAAPAAAS
ncbi:MULTISPECIES: hypothetical protein [unclassified Streptomyces]|uniref:hypothetical protein n=1 Tax=unclassified Streptomyces TaxID=2593676 RepID=UPI00165537EB|nr:hypothetical protein [Streptomyces sp. CB02980]MCB8903510.1 hypothetical protein [Streptomyces sp. CB02980]